MTNEIKFYPERIALERSRIEINGRHVGTIRRYDGEPYEATVLDRPYPDAYFSGESYEEVRKKIADWLEGRNF